MSEALAPLPADSEQFKLFTEACAKRGLVRIRYLTPMGDDPSLPEAWRKNGLPTVIEGNAIAIDEKEITFTQAIASVVPRAGVGTDGVMEQVTKIAQRTILRERILAIRAVGESAPKWEDQPKQE